jgi:c-di-GMP-related signal transduction protein
LQEELLRHFAYKKENNSNEVPALSFLGFNNLKMYVILLKAAVLGMAKAALWTPSKRKTEVNAVLI